jgi:hypothetical protein
MDHGVMETPHTTGVFVQFPNCHAKMGIWVLSFLLFPPLLLKDIIRIILHLLDHDMCVIKSVPQEYCYFTFIGTPKD